MTNHTAAARIANTTGILHFESGVAYFTPDNGGNSRFIPVADPSIWATLKQDKVFVPVRNGDIVVTSAIAAPWLADLGVRVFADGQRISFRMFEGGKVSC